MKKGLLTALLALALCVMQFPVAHAAGIPDPAAVRSNGSPYYIMVNRAACAVTIYSLDAKGYYSVPERAMICSVGKPETKTPAGTYRLSGYKNYWVRMVDDSYGQYISQFKGSYLFHSVCYSEKNTATLFTEEYNDLGTAVSHGCVRLQTADAKWIYENCPGGTTVVIYDDAADPSPFGMPQKAVAYLDPNGVGGTYDPTDPVEGNPWRGKVATGISLNSDQVELTVGHSLNMTATVTPATADASLRWQSSDPTVATVDENGRIIAQKAGTARISVNTGSYYAHVTVTVSGEGLRFTDVPAGASYYDAVRFVDDSGLMSGSGDRFSPEDRLSRVMGFQILYNLSGDTVLSDGDLWYSEALSWVKNNGLGEGMFLDDAFLQKGLSREDLALLLYRCELTCRKTAPQAEGDVTKFGDWDQISSSYERAMAWAVGAKILRGNGEGMLHPKDQITRGEAAEMLWRYMESRSV